MINHVILLALILLALRLSYTLLAALTSPQRDIPGPFLARFTRLWYFNRLRQLHFHHDNVALHEKYGPIVRLGPDLYSISTPDKAVYGIGSKFAKSDWYDTWKHPAQNRDTLFPERNTQRHAETRKKFQSLYSMSSVVSYEGYVDSCADILLRRLQEFAASGEIIDMGHWLQCYAFDVIGDITYGRRFGFLDRGEDIEGAMKALNRTFAYSTLAGVYAWLHPLLFRVMENLPRSGPAGRMYITKFVKETIDERNAARRAKARGEDTAAAHRAGTDMEKAEDLLKSMPEDFLDKITDAHDINPEKVTKNHILIMGLMNVFAGSDTTGGSLSSILHNLITSPVATRKLREEIEDFEEAGRSFKNKTRFRDAQEMPYLQAVIKEGLRVGSVVGLPLWRDVPEGGAEVCGRWFPAGTTVGVNPWVANYNENIFGKDAKTFRPERWIEAAKEPGDRLRSMEESSVSFGLGSRTCIGRHIATLEMAKLIPQLVRNLDFKLDMNEPYDGENLGFVKPVNFKVRIRARRTEEVVNGLH